MIQGDAGYRIRARSSLLGDSTGSVRGHLPLEAIEYRFSSKRSARLAAGSSAIARSILSQTSCFTNVGARGEMDAPIPVL